MIEDVHKCDKFCICPIHKTSLYYAKSTDDHACQDVNCRYGQGMNRVLKDDYLSSLSNDIFK